MSGRFASSQSMSDTLALTAAETLLERAPTSRYLERDRVEAMQAMGKYFLTLSAQPDLTRDRRAELKAEARLWFERSHTLWQSWSKQKIALPYAARREQVTAAALASLGL
jgi:hypothetical protein